MVEWFHEKNDNDNKYQIIQNNYSSWIIFLKIVMLSLEYSVPC